MRLTDDGEPDRPWRERTTHGALGGGAQLAEDMEQRIHEGDDGRESGEGAELVDRGGHDARGLWRGWGKSK